MTHSTSYFLVTIYGSMEGVCVCVCVCNNIVSDSLFILLRFEVFAALTTRSLNFCIMTPCSLADAY